MDKDAWKSWRQPNVTARIEEYWNSSSDERSHRENLAELCAKYLTDCDGVLKLGYGSAHVYEQLAAKLKRREMYVGVDLAMPVLELARAKFPEAYFPCAYGYKLPFKDQSFDLVVCFKVLGHVPDFRNLVAELIRVAKKRVIFTVWPAVDGVIEGRQDIDAHPFLYPYYSHGYVMEQLGDIAQDVHREPCRRAYSLPSSAY